jgi:hypothetical protein
MHGRGCGCCNAAGRTAPHRQESTMSRALCAALPAAVLAALLLAGAAHAADNPQHNRMAACNKEAGDRKGEERKAFMKDCLSNKKMTQQEKMKACNKEAAGKTGDERKAFMKRCLSA